MTRALVNANEFICRSAKMGALLQYVFATGERPYGLNSDTLEVWEAMVFLGLVNCKPNGRAWLSPGGEALLKLAEQGELETRS